MKNTINSNRLLFAILLLSIAFASCKKITQSSQNNPHVSNSNQEDLKSAAKKDSKFIAIEITGTILNQENTGSFSISDAFSASGSYYELYKFNGKNYQSDVTFSNSSGTITIACAGEITFSDASTATGSFTWRIKKATGIYENLAGNGTGSSEISKWNSAAGTGNIDQIWSGEVDTNNTNLN